MGGESRIVQVEGVVESLLPGGVAGIKLDDGRCINAEVSAKIKVRFVRVRIGDRVRCELSPIDPSKARIVDSL